MSQLNQIENLRLHSIYLDRNRELVEAIRDKQPRSVVAAIFKEIKQLYHSLHETQLIYTLRS